MKDEFIESFHGFVKDVKDARTLVEACIAGLIPTIRDYPLSNELTRIRSGTVIVFLEQTSDMMRIRWRDGLQWSASKLSGSFLLYREVERSRPNHSANDYSKNDCLFNITASSLRPNTRMVPGGLAKRTVTITGTDGKRYRVISYFNVNEVAHFYVPGSRKRSSSLCPLRIPTLQSQFTSIVGDVVKAQSPKRTPSNSPAADEYCSTTAQSPSLGAAQEACSCGDHLTFSMVHRILVDSSWLDKPIILAPLLATQSH